MTSVDSNFNFLCGRPHGAGPPVHMRPPEPDPLPPPCRRHKWMAPYCKFDDTASEKGTSNASGILNFENASGIKELFLGLLFLAKHFRISKANLIKKICLQNSYP